jgi:hypothetical protein
MVAAKGLTRPMACAPKEPGLFEVTKQCRGGLPRCERSGVSRPGAEGETEFLITGDQDSLELAGADEVSDCADGGVSAGGKRGVDAG